MSTHLTTENKNRPNPRIKRKRVYWHWIKTEFCTLNFALLFAMMLSHSKHAAYFMRIRDAPLDFKGGEQEVWVRTSFFFPPAWQGKFFFIFST